MNFYWRYGKRILDLCLVIPALVIAAPVMILTGLLVFINIGLPLFYHANRTGMHGRLFTMYKFRTMRNNCDAKGNLLPDTQRLTPMGVLLRKLSLDELPEFFNVLRGDMSLVGPRPLLPEYTDRYDREQRRRLDVPQGVTGWAQVNGRNSIGWNDKLSLDVWYVNHIGPTLDLKIMFLTIWKLITREGISHEGYVNMPEFLGNETRDMPPEEIKHRQSKFASTGIIDGEV